MTVKYKKFFSFILILVLALATGYSVGRLYVASIEPEVVSLVSREDCVEDESVVAELVLRSQKPNAKPSDFSAIELYEIAEYNLNHAENFYKDMTGLVDTIVKQNMRAQKIKVGDMYVFNKLSPSSMEIANICFQTVYNSSSGEIKINKKGSFVDTSASNLKANFSLDGFRNYTMQEYTSKDMYGCRPEEGLMPYIISSKTCSASACSAVSKDSNGNYVFEMSFDKAHLAAAGSCYACEIGFSSGMAPSWKNMKLKATVDENFNFVSIYYEESYSVDYGFMQPTVTDKFTDYFYFGSDVPLLTEILGREVA